MRPSVTWGAAYGVGLILIYLLVVAQFKELPDAAGHHGAHSAHHHWCDAWARPAGAQFTATSMIGMIALAGDHRAQLHLAGGFHRAAGGPGREFQRAVLQSAVVRAQPIVLTGRQP